MNVSTRARKGMDPRALLLDCRSRLPALLRCLQRAVEIESPSGSKHDIDRMADFFATELERRGATVRVLPNSSAGAALRADLWKGAGPGEPILLLGHHDTVWAAGTLAEMPFRIRGGRAYGPGALDMKAGIVCALGAFDALRSLGLSPSSPVRVFLNPDEEVSSQAFRQELRRQALAARAVLVLEPAQGRGALKTARKGVGEFELTVYGRAAHAGLNPEAGVNAIAELARQILRVEKLGRRKRGLTLNAGVIEGGTRSNVVPERATARIDVRIPRSSDREWIERRMSDLQPIDPRTRLLIRGGVNRPPMERRMAAALFRQAQAVGRQLGMELREATSGGGSDGSFTAALGVPTLDGLGAVGAGAHARHEHVLIRELPRRTALLAALLATL